MPDQFLSLCNELESDIQAAYEEGVTMERAERLAAKFLGAQIQVSTRLAAADLDSRMKKSGVKAIRAALYLNICKENPLKKPTEAFIESTLNSDEIVVKEQDSYDEAEANKAALERYYDIFCNAHIYMRGVAKGAFGG